MPSETLQSCIVNAATRLGTISTIASIDFQAGRALLIHDGRNLADSALRRPQTSIKLMEAPAPISESGYIACRHCHYRSRRDCSACAIELPFASVRSRSRAWSRSFPTIYKPKTMTGLSPAFPIPGKSLMHLSGGPVNFVFRCGFHRLAGTTRLLNIPMVPWAHLTFTSAGAATIGVSSLAAALKPSIG